MALQTVALKKLAEQAQIFPDGVSTAPKYLYGEKDLGPELFERTWNSLKNCDVRAESMQAYWFCEQWILEKWANARNEKAAIRARM